MRVTVCSTRLPEKATVRWSEKVGLSALYFSSLLSGTLVTL